MAKTSKLTKILKGVKHAQDLLDMLDTVVDVDRLIHISNAQGPLAKNLKSVLAEVLDEFESSTPSLPTKKARKKRLLTGG